MAQFGVLPLELWWPWLLGGTWWLQVMLLLLVGLRRAEPEVSGDNILPSTKNKPGGTPNRLVLARSGRGGCGWRWGTGRSGVPEVNHEASASEVHQQRRARAAAFIGQRGHFAPRSFELRQVFFLQARVPIRRIFINLDSAPYVGIAPSGFFPGGVLGDRYSEVLPWWWRRRTRLLSLAFSKVLFEKSEDCVVILLFLLFLLVTCTHRI
jgi:hypothetical protein